MLLLRLFLFVLLPGSESLGGELLRAMPPQSRQLVLVTTDSWTSRDATLQRFTRGDARVRWVPAGAPMRAQVGENGLGWGRGLQRDPPDQSRQKREGDRRAPAGVFRLTSAFGQIEKAEIGSLRLPYRRMTSGWEAVDDPASRFYNRIVNRAAIPRPDWRTSERLWRGAHYRLALVIDHNADAIPGAGSCIFLHERVARSGTAGCTVLRREDLWTLVRWLDSAAQPVLVQAPRSEVGTP